MQTSEPRKAGSGVYIAILIAGLIILSVIAFTVLGANHQSTSSTATENSSQEQQLISILEAQNAALQKELAANVSTSTAEVGLDPVTIYRNSVNSVVTIQGTQLDAEGNESVLGSGFVVNESGAYYIVTNFHVVQNDTGITVTFADGDAYPATVVGTDPYSDLAVLSTSAPSIEFEPLQLASSSTLSVGQPVIAIGNPFGLSGSETYGIVSALGRTISESLAGNFPIADVIQFSAPINPGNSGGPLINAAGQVIGMTTATVESSQGVGFAIPSDTILRELPSLIATGQYNMHSYVGIETADMDYQLSVLEKTNVTYGVLVESVVAGGPASAAGMKGGSTTATVEGVQYSIGGDIIVSINGTKVVDGDSLSTYLEENTLPGQTVVFGIIRGGQYITIDVVLGTRPPPPG